MTSHDKKYKESQDSFKATFQMQYAGQMFQNVDIDYDKFYGCIDKAFGEHAKIESFVKLSFKFDDKFFDGNVYFRSTEFDHYYNSTLVREICFKFEEKYYLIRVASISYEEGKRLCRCYVDVYNEENVSEKVQYPNDLVSLIDNNEVHYDFYKYYHEIELSADANIIGEVIKNVSRDLIQR